MLATTRGLGRAAFLAKQRGLGCAGRWSSSELEFTIAPYHDVPALGYERSDKFCMMTLRYPEFQSLPLEERRAVYDRKRKRRAEFIEELFDRFDADSSGSLDKVQLQNALREIGLAWDDGSIQDILHRKDTDSSGTISREEFPEVVKEAWGKIPDLAFSDRLSEIHQGHQGVEPLCGNRAVMFIGRTSPAGWALRSVRNMWPHALRRCQIFQNVCDNPDMNAEHMKAWMSDYNSAPEMHVEGVARVAAESGTTSKGGLVVRLDPVDVTEGPEFGTGSASSADSGQFVLALQCGADRLLAEFRLMEDGRFQELNLPPLQMKVGSEEEMETWIALLAEKNNIKLKDGKHAITLVVAWYTFRGKLMVERYSCEMIAHSWQPEFPEFESDTMGRTYTQNKVSWLDDAEENLAEICRALSVLAEFAATITPELGFNGGSRTRIMAHGVSTEDDKKQLALPAQGIQVEATVLQDRLLFRDQRKVCIVHFVGDGDGTLTLHRPGSEDLQVDCKDGHTLIFRHDVLDYSFNPTKGQFAMQVWLLRDPLPGELMVSRDRSFNAAEEQKRIPAGPLYGTGNETVDVIGMAVRDPGSTNGIEDYWAVLSGGTDTIIRVPLQRWDLELYYSPEPDAQAEGKGYIQHFGMLSDEQMSMFDNEFFNLSPHEVRFLDPVQRNCLEVGQARTS
ncbi:ppsC [Symbiodinium pilosum]|uniref:PpsC protein n=1 Tax=Symbiodinium pilosum TaxID=2952 RepID=A0A812W9E0_SYMPI|nr:ppsC [Symbiodinium pilosum]